MATAARRPRIARKQLLVALAFLGGALALLAIAGGHGSPATRAAGPEPARDSITGEADAGAGTTPGDGPELARQAAYWNDRVTYPTGRFDPAWLRQAARQDRQVPRGVPAGAGRRETGTGPTLQTALDAGTATAATPLNASTFTSLGPAPEHMTGCSGCYDYGTTAGRVNAIVVDPTTTTPGSITAYAAAVGGGVWKTTNCCSTNTTWSVTTDDVAIPDISVDALALDPNDHNTIYAGTGDLNFGSYSMGSQGVLKSTDGGQSWTVLGTGVFGPRLNGAGHFPQYQSVGKVAVDPNDSQKVVAATKTGLRLSYDGGTSWSAPCATNTFSTQRQDVTGLVLSNISGSTRILAAVGVRGFSSPVQDDLGNNGANGVYTATMPASGCPTFTSIARNNNGFVFGSSVNGSPYATGANMNAGTGTAYGGNTTTGDQLGRLELAVAPSDPNTIYVQAQSIAANSNSACGGNPGCQLGMWASTDSGTSWTFLAGSAGGSLRDCSPHGGGDYNQNWYDQSLAVDPNNADKFFVGTYDVYSATRTGTSLTDVTCGYSFSGPTGPVHTDQHALAFLPGSSSTLLLGDDGGVHGTTTATSAPPTFFNMDGGFDTIEFYSGDISADFATAPNPQANGGAQDNGSSSVTFSGSPTGPAQWQMGVGGDGFFARIDPVGHEFFQGGNSGHIYRCHTSCTAAGAAWSDISNATMLNDQQAFMLPYEVFKGTPGNGSTDCPGTTCSHLLAGTYRVWENLHASGIDGTSSWYVASPDLTKGTLGTRSFINQLAYSPATDTLGMAGTNDGNVWVGRNLGTGVTYGNANSAVWTNVTASNAVLPNRPILDVTMAPSSLNTVGAPIAGYAAVGGFDANTASTPGHVFALTCDVNCANPTWADKTGNLPDLPVDSIIANPNIPQQVFAGTDFGLYFTNDITIATPTWTKFTNGIPSAMIWDLQVDRGATTLSAWTRGRGAYVWPLPVAGKLNQTISVSTHAPATAKFGKQFNVAATASSGLTVSYGTTGGCSIVAQTVTIDDANQYCTVSYDQAGNGSYNAAPQVTEQVVVSPASTTTTVTVTPYAPNPTAQVGDTVNLSATVTPATTNSGNETFSGSVQFTAGGAALGPATAVSDSSPTAQFDQSLAGITAGAAISATFTPDPGDNFAGSTPTGTHPVVQAEGAKANGSSDGSVRLDYAGGRAVNTGTAPVLKTTLRQSLSPESGDAEFVDFGSTDVPVVFDLYKAGCGGGCVTTPVWTSGSVLLGDSPTWATDGSGTATATAPANLTTGAYLVTVRLVDTATLVGAGSTSALVVAPTSGSFTAAGGTVPHDSTSNSGSGAGSFGVLAKTASGSVTGNGLYVFRMRADIGTSTTTNIVACTTLGGSCHDVDVIVRSSSMKSLRFGKRTTYPLHAHLTGTDVVQVVDAVTGTHYAGLESTGGVFRADATDGSSGGTGDRFGLTAYRADGTTTYHQAFVPTSGARVQSGLSAPTNQVGIGAGGVTVHR
jgi:hypothetical protein